MHASPDDTDAERVPRTRIGRGLAWRVSLVSMVALATIVLASFFLWIDVGYGMTPRGIIYASVGSGSLYIHFDPNQTPKPEWGWWTGVRAQRPPSQLPAAAHLRIFVWTEMRDLTGNRLGVGVRSMRLPLWIPTAACALLPAREWARHRLRRTRQRRGRCRTCGYDLRATPGRCPECGTAAHPISR